MTILYIYCI